MPRYLLDVTHRPERDGTILTAAHVPYYLALEVSATAWGLALEAACVGVLTPRQLAVVSVVSEFRRELFTGPVLFDVRLLRYGRSSLTFGVELTQNDRSAATVTTTLALVDDARLHSVPLSDAQRARLDGLAASPADTV